jgi:hypothetical protein
MIVSAVEKFYLTALGLVGLYLVLAKPQAVNQILQGIGSFNVSTFGVLQGRNVSGGSVSG